MMYLNSENFHMAAFCAPRFLALAILIFLGAGGAFALDAVYVTGWDSDVEALVLVGNSVEVYPDDNALFHVRLDLGNGGTASEASDLGGYLWDMNNSLHRLPTIVDRLNTVLSNMVVHGQSLTHIEQYTQLSSENSTNLPAIKTALYYNDGSGNTESVAEILADIRDNGLSSGGVDLGVAFTNFVYSLSPFLAYGDTNYTDFVTLLADDSDKFGTRYGLEPLYYQFLYDGLPLIKGGVNVDSALYPSSFNVAGRSNQQLYMNNIVKRHDRWPGNNTSISNVLDRAAIRKYDAYNTYQSRLMLSNLFYNANMLTWTNQQADGINANNYALQWFDSYNTKFQNMLLEYGTLAVITNENKRQVEFARNWYDSYSPRVILDYLIMSDYLSGTNDLATMAEGVSSTINDYAMEKLPKWGMNTNSASLDMGTIPSTENAGYKSQGDAIQAESEQSAGYLNKGWTVFDTVQESYDTTIETIISKIHDGSDGGVEGAKSGGHQGLSLRIAALESEYVNIPEQYIDFNLPSDAKDKLKDFWALIKKCLEWGMWTWAFFVCWGMLCDRDFKQASPTILD